MTWLWVKWGIPKHPVHLSQHHNGGVKGKVEDEKRTYESLKQNGHGNMNFRVIPVNKNTNIDRNRPAGANSPRNDRLMNPESADSASTIFRRCKICEAIFGQTAQWKLRQSQADSATAPHTGQTVWGVQEEAVWIYSRRQRCHCDVQECVWSWSRSGSDAWKQRKALTP